MQFCYCHTFNTLKKIFIGLLKSIMKCDHFFVLSKKFGIQ